MKTLVQDRKSEFLAELSSFCSTSKEPYIIRLSSERNKVERLHRHSGMSWSNNQENPTQVKLVDRVLMSKTWESIFPHVIIQKLPRKISDHNPLIVCTDTSESKGNLGAAMQGENSPGQNATEIEAIQAIF
jgi:hypothetical protein